MRKYGFRQSNSDYTLFLKHQGSKITTLIVYVDDMIIPGDDQEEILRLQEQLAAEFETKNLGELKYFQGLRFLDSSKVHFFLSERISQTCYQKLDYWSVNLQTHQQSRITNLVNTLTKFQQTKEGTRDWLGSSFISHIHAPILLMQ